MPKLTSVEKQAVEKPAVESKRWWLSNKSVATVAALSALLTLGIVACGGSDAAPTKAPVQRTKNAALPTTTTCVPRA